MNSLKEHEASHHCRAIVTFARFPKARGSALRAALATLLFVVLPLCAEEAPPTVMAGTKLRVQFNNEVGTAISRVDDGLEVHLLKPVEAQGREVLPVGTILTGRVISVRKGDTHRKVFPVLRLAFEQVRLPDGRTFPVKASVADLGMMVNLDSEGAATPAGHTKADNVAGAAGAAGIGAGVGAIGGGGSGAAKGAAVGAGIGVIGDLLTRNDAYWDFTLKRGRKAWLRLDDDFSVTSPPSLESEKAEIQGPSAPPQLPQGSATASARPAPPKPENKGAYADLTVPVVTIPASSKSENKGVVYVEPAPKARFYRVNTEALLQDLNKAEVPLTMNPSQADYVLRVWDDRQGFHAVLTGPSGLIAWTGSAHTQGGITRGVVRYLREHATLKPEP